MLQNGDNKHQIISSASITPRKFKRPPPAPIVVPPKRFASASGALVINLGEVGGSIPTLVDQTKLFDQTVDNFDNDAAMHDGENVSTDEESFDSSDSSKTEKGCRCGRTKCLKQYCFCFRNDKRCSGDCVCQDCRNDGKHEFDRINAVRHVRMHSNNAFQGTELYLDGQEIQTPGGSTRTIRGCRCKKSLCQKKYCECFSVGLKCTSGCVCTDCANGNEMSQKSNDSGDDTTTVDSTTSSFDAFAALQKLKNQSHAKVKPESLPVHDTATHTMYAPQSFSSCLLGPSAAPSGSESMMPMAFKPELDLSSSPVAALGREASQTLPQPSPLSGGLGGVPASAWETDEFSASALQFGLPSFSPSSRLRWAAGWGRELSFGALSPKTPVGNFLGAGAPGGGGGSTSLLSALAVPLSVSLSREVSGTGILRACSSIPCSPLVASPRALVAAAPLDVMNWGL